MIASNIGVQRARHGTGEFVGVPGLYVTLHILHGQHKSAMRNSCKHGSGFNFEHASAGNAPNVKFTEDAPQDLQKQGIKAEEVRLALPSIGRDVCSK